MSDAWKILAALTLARLCMGFQFQAIPALAASLGSAGDLSFAALGTLTGAYLLPGVAAALGGGWLGQRLGDIRTALWGLALMTAGGLGGWLAESYPVALSWRLLAGVGAVGLNVMLTKMAGDWFQDRDDLPTAMGVLTSSWPAGIAVAMLVLPPLATSAGLGAALLVPPILCAASLAMLAGVWRAPPQHGAATGRQTGGWLSRGELVLVVTAGSIWGLYNVTLIAMIAWTPGLLAARGIDPVTAAASVSLIGWAAIFSVAAGGWLAARARWRDLPALACFVLSAVALLALPGIGALAAAPWAMLGLGLLIGPPAAVIMTLPVEAARPRLRALAMGVYLAVYYGMMGVAPALMGALRDATGSAAAPLYAAAALLGVCLALWAAFRGLQRRAEAATVA